MIKALAPYCHCREPLDIKSYRIGIIMPGLILGMIPFIFGMALKIEWLVLYGLIFTGGAGGDFIMLWLTWHLTPGTIVLDCPDKIGCYVLDN